MRLEGEDCQPEHLSRSSAHESSRGPRLHLIAKMRQLGRPLCLLALACVMQACSGSTGIDTTSSSAMTDGGASTSVTISTLAPPTTSTTTLLRDEFTTFLVWTSGGLTDELVAGLDGRFDVMSIVMGDAALMDVGDDQVVPLDAVAIDRGAHAWFDTEGETAVLRPGIILLGETSAAYRQKGPGDVLSFGGSEFAVGAVVSDDLVGAAEVVFSQDDPKSPVSTNRYALILTDMSRRDFDELIETLNRGSVPAVIRAEGETPWLRHADAVLPQVFIKLALGEFSYPSDSGPELVQDGSFVSENIVTADVPILGTITCHRVVVEMVSGALTQLVDEGLSDLIDPGEFAGCWNPRFIKTVTGKPAGVSRHSWGAALDINAVSNRLGAESSQDARLVEIMKEWGFLWGGEWAVPDAMHFEYGILPGE